MVDSDWRASVSIELRVELTDWRQLGGGDFAQSWQATVKSALHAAHDTAKEHETHLQPGCKVFIKTHANPPPSHFSTEALGLCWMAEAQCVNVPAVLAVSDDPPYLALQWIDEGSRTHRGEVQLGEELAGLHRASCLQFGRLDERSTGSLGLPNRPAQSWAEFYGTQRLQPLVKIARQRRALSEACLQKIESLSEKLDQFGGAAEPPSRLHGDLWAGNRLVDKAGVNWLIDPACHGGHREFDLAMMRLFGGYDEACFRAYDEIHPLSDGWRDRIALHQLAPLIVHAIKFGGSYVEPTESALNQYL